MLQQCVTVASGPRLGGVGPFAEQRVAGEGQVFDRVVEVDDLFKVGEQRTRGLVRNYVSGGIC